MLPHLYRCSLMLCLQHEDWSADVRGSPNDLALLELSHAVEFSAYVQPACLPAYTNEEFTSQDECWISGWGDTKGTVSSNPKIFFCPLEQGIKTLVLVDLQIKFLLNDLELLDTENSLSSLLSLTKISKDQ